MESDWNQWRLFRFHIFSVLKQHINAGWKYGKKTQVYTNMPVVFPFSFFFLYICNHHKNPDTFWSLNPLLQLEVQNTQRNQQPKQDFRHPWAYPAALPRYHCLELVSYFSKNLFPAERLCRTYLKIIWC
jgi:hypothetical protein